MYSCPPREHMKLSLLSSQWCLVLLPPMDVPNVTTSEEQKVVQPPANHPECAGLQVLISHKKMYVPLLDGTSTLQKLLAVLSTMSIAPLLGLHRET